MWRFIFALLIGKQTSSGARREAFSEPRLSAEPRRGQETSNFKKLICSDRYSRPRVLRGREAVGGTRRSGTFDC